MAFDFGELFTASVRHVVPMLVRKRLPFAFDCRLPPGFIDADSATLRLALHRVLAASVRLVDVGFQIFDVTSRPQGHRHCTLTVKVGATGMLASNAVLDEIARSLDLSWDLIDSAGETPRLRRAFGRCPLTDALVDLSTARTQGAVLTIEFMKLRFDAAQASAQRVSGASAWLVSEDGVAAESLARRLARMGWTTVRIDSLQHAVRRLRATPPVQPRPSLLVVIEPPSLDPAQIIQLDEALPTETQRIYARTSRDPMEHGAFECCAHPLSPGDLLGLASDHGVRSMRDSLLMSRHAA
jgi:hypothetical protein